MKSAALYIRVSTEDQMEFSPDAQKKALLKYANANGYVIEKNNTFTDEGISGRHAEKRPAFMRMIAQAKSKAHPFDAILVHKFDRFARSREDSVVYKSLLKKECGVKVISITESIEDDKFSIILEAMLEAMAEYYSMNLSEEVKKGMTEKALRGGLQSAPPFGYAVCENILVPLPEEAALIKEIFYRFISGDGLFPIAKWLNSLGIKTHRGSRFENRTIEYIIRNPAYIGKLRWNPTGKTRRDFDNENIILTDAAHEPLIDMQIWNAAQKRIAEVKAQWKYHGRPLTEHKEWISGLVRCSACGCTLVFTKPHYWKCNGYARGSCRHSQHVRDGLIKEALIRQLELDTTGVRGLQYKMIHPKTGGVDQIAALYAQAEKLRKKIDRLRNAYLDGIETAEEYGQAKHTVESELAEIEKQMSDLRNHEVEVDIEKCIRASIADTLYVLHDPNTSNRDKHNAAQSVMKRCEFDKENNLLTIWYRYVF